MGQAKQRGTREQRVQEAQARAQVEELKRAIMRAQLQQAAKVATDNLPKVAVRHGRERYRAAAYALGVVGTIGHEPLKD